ncbi:MAG: HAD-IIA family hydrolase [Kiritimatiellae bacterium]|nr:HAD-IIA family hydrolase [Kiritimatiellia bacterium]MDD5519347.1 HAD-IIA family hydrolase [Kiritimatiellia bacterium]
MIKGIILDLDGTVYLGDAEVPGAGTFTVEMKTRGVRCLFVTNRANRAPEEVCVQLQRYGIACEIDDVLTSAQATVQYLKKGKVFYIGEKTFGHMLEENGFEITEDSPDYVIVSFDRYVTPEIISKAAKLVKKGAKFIATNPDKALKIEGGILPGTGAIVDAVAGKAGVKPAVMIGKPEKLIIEMGIKRLGMRKEEVILVGDNVETDIPAGVKAGIRTALILTGISTRKDLCGLSLQPTWVVESYGELSKIVDAERN